MRYHNFDLFIEEKDNLGYRTHAHSRGFDDVYGRIEIDPHGGEIAVLTEGLLNGPGDEHLCVATGTLLYDSLFTQKGNRDVDCRFQQFLGKFQDSPDDGVRLRLHIAPPELAALPWEFLCAPGSETFLSAFTKTPLVRYLDVARPVPMPKTREQLRMLVVVAACPHLGTLDTAAEKSALSDVLAGVRDRIQPTFLEGEVSLRRMEETLGEKEFHIFHFIGHGGFVRDHGVLYLEEEALDDKTLGQLFQNCAAMQLVVLNACRGAQVSSSQPFMGIAPQLVKRGVPAVVAMQYPIFDDAAVCFSRSFYHALLKGVDRGRIDVAVTRARNTLLMHYPKERAFGTPVLFLRTPHGMLFDLPKEREEPRQDLRSETDRMLALKETQEHNRRVVKDSPELDKTTKAALIEDAEQKIREIKRAVRHQKVYSWGARLCAVLLLFLLWMRAFDWLTLDTRVESYTMALGRALAPIEFSPNIAILLITDGTIKELQRKGFGPDWRQDYDNLVRNLNEAGAKVVVFDMHFESHSPYDADFAKAMHDVRECTPIILGVRKYEEGRPVLVDQLKEAASGYGALSGATKLGHTRTVVLAVSKNRGGERIPGLALQAYGCFTAGNQVRIDRVDLNRGEVLWETRKREPNSHPAFQMETISSRTAARDPDDIVDEGDVVADLAIDITPLAVIEEKARYDLYTSVLNNINPEELREYFEGKIVLIGAELEGKDVHGDRWGLDWQADAINTLLNDAIIHPARPWAQFAVILVLALAGARIRASVDRHSPRWVAKVLLAVVLCLYLLFAFFLYAAYSVLLNSMYHIVALFGTYWFVDRLDRLTSNVETAIRVARKWCASMWGALWRIRALPPRHA